MLKLRVLLEALHNNQISEQSVNNEIQTISNILNTQHAIFVEAIAKLKSIEYSNLSENVIIMLRDNANILCEAYTEYCDNTRSTIKQYPDGNVDDIVDEHATTLFNRIKDGLTY